MALRSSNCIIMHKTSQNLRRKAPNFFILLCIPHIWKIFLSLCFVDKYIFSHYNRNKLVNCLVSCAVVSLLWCIWMNCCQFQRFRSWPWSIKTRVWIVRSRPSNRRKRRTWSPMFPKIASLSQPPWPIRKIDVYKRQVTASWESALTSQFTSMSK